MTRFDEPADLPAWSRAFDPPTVSRFIGRSEAPQWPRAWNHWIGGRDSKPVDRALCEHIDYDSMARLARAVRYFRARAVRHLADDLGIRQFVELGAELPVIDHTHQVAQAIDPTSRVVYIDDDEATLDRDPAGEVAYARVADLHDAAEVLSRVADNLDVTEPIALVLVNVLDFVPVPVAANLVAELAAPLAPGSHVLITHFTQDDDPAADPDLPWYEHWNRAAPHQLITPRTGDEITAWFFRGLELLEPGVVPVGRWRPDPSPFASVHVPALGGVARKVSRPGELPPPRHAFATAGASP